MHFVKKFTTLRNKLCHFEKIITKCGTLLQNGKIKLLHFGHLVQNSPLLQNTFTKQR